MQMKRVLITGISGLVGRQLAQLLLQKGYEVNGLGRSVPTDADKRICHFTWDVAKQKIDPAALEGVTAIVHLAGAGVADKRWTADRKREIKDSRVQSTRLLYKALQKHAHTVQVIVSASAVGYYGDCGDKPVTEEHPAATTFLADVCVAWEKEVMKFTALGLREVRCRIGIILSNEGGALPELTRTLPLGVAGYFAKKHLWYPWIHINDVCGIFLHAIENPLQGAYNTTAPHPLPLKYLMHEIVKAARSKALVLPVPPIGIQLAMGEMADMLLSSQRCSAARITGAGYTFRYPTAARALRAIYQR